MWDGKNSLRWANALVFLVCWLTCLCLKSYKSTEGVLFWWFVFELTAGISEVYEPASFIFFELLRCTSAISTLVRAHLLRPFLAHEHSKINWCDLDLSPIWIRNRKIVGKLRIKTRHGRLDFAPKLTILPLSKYVTARTHEHSRWSFCRLTFLKKPPKLIAWFLNLQF